MTVVENEYRMAKMAYDAAMAGPNRRYEQAEHLIVAKYEKLRLQDPFNEARTFQLRRDQASDLRPHQSRLERETAPIKAAFEAASREAREKMITERSTSRGASPSELAERIKRQKKE